MGNTTTQATATGTSAVEYIEFAGGYGEKFLGSIDQAEALLFRRALVEKAGAVFTLDVDHVGVDPQGVIGDVMRKATEYGFDFYEWAYRPHGEDWAFVGRIYCTLEGKSAVSV